MWNGRTIGELEGGIIVVIEERARGNEEEKFRECEGWDTHLERNDIGCFVACDLAAEQLGGQSLHGKVHRTRPIDARKNPIQRTLIVQSIHKIVDAL